MTEKLLTGMLNLNTNKDHSLDFALFEPRHEKTGFLQYAETKTQISCAVTAQLISAFVFAIRIVQSLYFLNAKFQASSRLLWLYNLVCVGPGRKPGRPVFSERGSFEVDINFNSLPAGVVCG